MARKIDYVIQRVQELAKTQGRVRLVLVYNPRSSKAKRVETEVLQPLRGVLSERGTALSLIKYKVQPTHVDDNATRLAGLLKDDDVVVAAGGDGTAAIVVNGAMLSKQELYVWAMPLGNFNDMARAFEKARGEERRLYPLEAKIEGKHYRYAACYFTIGLFAESTEVFDAPAQRKQLQKGKKSLVYSVKELAKWYFKNRKKEFIPEFELKRGKVKGEIVKGASDYLAVNGITVARMMRGGEWYTQRSGFLSTTRNLTGFLRLVGFMTQSIMRRVPGVVSQKDEISFAESAEIEIQAEGEYKRIVGVKKIEVSKSERSLKIL